jgi:hypothetical protein
MGNLPILIKDIFSYFISNNKDYKYSVTITKEVYTMFEDMQKNILKISWDTFVRAAHFYYSSICPNELVIREDKNCIVNNTTIGWKKMQVRGSLAMKYFLFEKKKETNKNINLIINNVLYSFLNNIRSDSL